MIIECQTCRARFRLDEAKIKGRGARVRCRKCGDSIVVLKDSAPAPPATGGEGFFDLGSAVRDTPGESPASQPPGGNLIPFPASSRPAEPAVPEPPRSVESPEPGKDEVDLAFDRFLSSGVDASSPSAGEPEAAHPGPADGGVPSESEAAAGVEPRAESDPGALTLDLGPEEKLDLPPPAEMPATFGEQPPDEPAAEFRGEGGFLISDSDTLDFLQENRRDAGSEIPSAWIGDISREISSLPADTPVSSPGVPAATPASPEDWAITSPAGVSTGEDVPAPAPVVEVAASKEAEPAPEPRVSIGSPAPVSPRTRSNAGPAAAAVVAVLLAAGGYFGLTTSGRNMLSAAAPRISALFGGYPASPAASKYDLRNVIGYYESGIASPRILVIKGQVANLSAVAKSGIRVHAALMDNTDVLLAQQAVYAGNVLTGEAIRKRDRNALSKALGNRFGEGLANLNVAPGATIPFMVVFFDAPENIDSYKLEAKDGE